MAQLSDTRVLVTGGTSGLGLAMAHALVRGGRQGGGDQPSSANGRRQPRRSWAAGRVGVELDVRDAGSVSAAVDRAYGSLGGLDLLVNNAGIGMRTVNPRFMTEPQPFWEVPPAGFRDVLETKATGTFLVAREVVPRMLSAGAGRVVTISMSEQTMTRRGFVPYGPSGAAVEALARVMAADLADTPVTANILLPGGATATGMVPDEMPIELRQQPARPRDHGTADRLAGLSGGSRSPRRADRRPHLRRLAGGCEQRAPVTGWSPTRRCGCAGALAVLTPWPATGSTLAVLQLLLGPANAAGSRRRLLGILDPADELVAGQRCDVLPGIERCGIGDQRLPEVCWKLVHHPTGHS